MGYNVKEGVLNVKLAPYKVRVVAKGFQKENVLTLSKFSHLFLRKIILDYMYLIVHNTLKLD